MPAKNVIKSYVTDGIYHVYNRGVNKANIFFDDQDYHLFLSYISAALSPKDTKKLSAIVLNDSLPYQKRREGTKLLRLKNFTGKIDLLAYCLMPNHFHLLLKQHGDSDMSAFIQAIMTRFSVYINRRYKRVGRVFQGPYKAVLVTNDEQLLHVSRYIHRNPISLKRPRLFRLNLLRSQPSSYPNYLGEIEQSWMNPHPILSYFSGKKNKANQSYQTFVESVDDDLESQSLSFISKVSLDLA